VKLRLARVWNSNFLLLAILVVICDLVLVQVVPRFDHDWYLSAISANDELFCGKVFRYLIRRNEPHVLMLGSSVVAVPAYACDQAEERKITSNGLPHMGLYSGYSNCDHLAHELTTLSTREPIDVVNLGLAGTVASDYVAIMEKLIQFHQKPLLIVCGVSPQEFVWNDVRGINNTHVRKAFHTFSWPGADGSLLQFAGAIEAEIGWHIATLQAELGSVKGQLAWNFAGAIHRIPKEDPKPAQKQLNAGDSENPLSHIQVHSPKQRTTVDQFEDLKLYQKQYSNLDMGLFHRHMENFRRALELARSNNIPIAVVNMPLTDKNKALLPQSVKNLFYSGISTACKDHGVPYINMDAPGAFAYSDFYDSAHLNEHGGKKLFDRLARSIAVENSGDGVKLSAVSTILE
jgi:hypothetical protein